ncbi:MAG: hypothetical protein NTV44_04005, partial [Firmicutes bacterium]|nr:hypothetical protein [Bacillota bacterium]
MTSRYRRSDHAALLFVSGLLFLFAGLACLIVDSGDARLLKTIAVIVFFFLSAFFVIFSILYNSTGHSITISDKTMAIKCYKEFMFVSGELARTGKALFWYRTFTVNIADIESFGALNGKEIYQ